MKESDKFHGEPKGAHVMPSNPRATLYFAKDLGTFGEEVELAVITFEYYLFNASTYFIDNN